MPVTSEHQGEGLRCFHEGCELHKEWVNLNKLVFLILPQQGNLPFKNTKYTTGTCSYFSEEQKWLCCGPFDQTCCGSPGQALKSPGSCQSYWAGHSLALGNTRCWSCLSVCPFKAKGGVVCRTSPLLCVLNPTWEARGCAGCDGEFSEVNSS